MCFLPHTQSCYIFVISLDCWPDLKCLSPLLSQCSQLVPQVTDALAALVHSSHIMVIQLTRRKTGFLDQFVLVVEIKESS